MIGDRTASSICKIARLRIMSGTVDVQTFGVLDAFSCAAALFRGATWFCEHVTLSFCTTGTAISHAPGVYLETALFTFEVLKPGITINGQGVIRTRSLEIYATDQWTWDSTCLDTDMHSSSWFLIHLIVHRWGSPVVNVSSSRTARSLIRCD